MSYIILGIIITIVIVLINQKENSEKNVPENKTVSSTSKNNQQFIDKKIDNDIQKKKTEEDALKEFEKKINDFIEELCIIANKYIDHSIPPVTETEGRTYPITFIKMQKGNSMFFEKDINEISHPDTRVIQIGWALHHLGGLKLMQYVYYQILYKFAPDSGNLSIIWHGVGSWRK